MRNKKIIALCLTIAVTCFGAIQDTRIPGNLVTKGTSSSDSTKADLGVTGDLKVYGHGVFGRFPMIPGYALDINDSGPVMSGLVQAGLYSEPIFSSSATTAASAIRAAFKCAPGSYTIANGAGMTIEMPNIGAGAQVANLYGVRILGVFGGTNNYALGTFGGGLNIQMASSDSALFINGASRFSGPFKADSIVQLGYTILNKQVSHAITVISTQRRSLDASMDVVALDASNLGDTMIVFLPTAVSSTGREYTIYRTDTTGRGISIACVGTDTIEGTTGLHLYGNKSSRIKIRSTGIGRTANRSNWLIDYIEEEGYFRGIVSGFTVADTQTITWQRYSKNRITYKLPVDTTRTSNSTSIQISGAPSYLSTTNNTWGSCLVYDNGVSYIGIVGQPGSGGSGNISVVMMRANATTLGLTSAAFTGSGHKGFGPCENSYTVDTY